MIIQNGLTNIAFKYGWDAYPVNIIWALPANALDLDSIVKMLPVDGIIIPDGQISLFEKLITESTFSQDIVPVSGFPADGYRMYLKPE